MLNWKLLIFQRWLKCEDITYMTFFTVGGVLTGKSEYMKRGA